jgi:hypothetical protein
MWRITGWLQEIATSAAFHKKNKEERKKGERKG